MKQELMTEVMQQMLPYLDNAQLKQLRQAMEQTLYHYEVTGTEQGRRRTTVTLVPCSFTTLIHCIIFS